MLDNPPTLHITESVNTAPEKQTPANAGSLSDKNADSPKVTPSQSAPTTLLPGGPSHARPYSSEEGLFISSSGCRFPTIHSCLAVTSCDGLDSKTPWKLRSGTSRIPIRQTRIVSSIICKSSLRLRV
ncbi:hypothetical protein K469DRAFT_278934 [Zopfia rhizophila CBS 207.26]|uniref:Uncharacterized protein n=1 Tax=Zopfia rhizophila CBS 207.26 TaxID=1314779 RepID=A0A6A6DPX5_9PEZI|nr:hypothetical protein K469DRAFT_278934 [Zopfia rhizophila CBS 207.26]